MEEKRTFFCNNMHQNHFIIELTKTCGYSEWFLIMKSYTLKDVFRYVKTLLRTEKFKLYVKDSFNNTCFLEESDYELNEFIRINHSFFRPIYDLPYQVVYRLYVDDGHCHHH
jgi:hypothetical protein